MDSKFNEELKRLSKKLNIELTDTQIEKFYNYKNLLLEWNQKINLTAITEEYDIILKHFIDSITILKYIENGKNIVDIGTGAGFPGIPISIVNEDIRVTLVDSLNKRVLFLNDVIEKNQLKNVNTVHSRAEDLGQNKSNREKYDYSVSRAVANLSVLVEYLLPLVKVGGKCICMKGTNNDEEIENAKYAINELGGEIEKIDKFYLPDTDMERTIIIIKKIKETNKKYPRKSGTPSKQPLSK